jgi:hypothetical protein
LIIESNINKEILLSFLLVPCVHISVLLLLLARAMALLLAHCSPAYTASWDRLRPFHVPHETLAT